MYKVVEVYDKNGIEIFDEMDTSREIKVDPRVETALSLYEDSRTEVWEA